MGKPVEVRVLSRAIVKLDHSNAGLALPFTSFSGRRQAAMRSVTVSYFFAAAFLLAAQRAFINWESFLRPAGVIPRFFLAEAAFIPAFILAQRARAAAASLAFVAADTWRRPA